MPSAEEKAALSNKCKTITTCLKDSPDDISQFYLPDILTAKQLCSLSSSTSIRSRFCKKIWRFFIFLSKYLSKPIKTALPLTYLLLKYSHGRLVAFVPFASLSRQSYLILNCTMFSQIAGGWVGVGAGACSCLVRILKPHHPRMNSRGENPYTRGRDLLTLGVHDISFLPKGQLWAQLGADFTAV